MTKNFEHKGAFRNSAAFGKRIEYWVIGLLLKQGFDVFVPIVDDDGIDAIIRGDDGRKLDIQIKARSNAVRFGSAGIFSTGQSHSQVRDDYYFIFYSEKIDQTWVMSSADYLENCTVSKTGKNKGFRKITLAGASKKMGNEYPNPRFKKWLATKDGEHDFSVLQDALETS